MHKRERGPQPGGWRRYLAPRWWPTWLAIGVLRLAVLLPLPLMLAAGRTLGRIALLLPLPYQRIARRNIELCLPELNAPAREALIARHFAALGIGLIESAMCWWSSDARIDAHSRLEGLEHLNEALAAGHGAIVLAAHFTTLELGARILNRHVAVSPLYRPLKNQLLAEISGGSFARRARQAIRHDDVRAMIGALKHNEIVWYLPDQSYRKKGAAMVPFFGHPAATNVFTSRLAALTGAKVLYFSTERLPGSGGWLARLYPPFAGWPGPDPVEDTLRYHACIEAQVRRVPEQYWWIHRRFKGLDPCYPDYYGGRRP
jgi:KDO2-lipid IV(A) lauroyltransferase